MNDLQVKHKFQVTDPAANTTPGQFNRKTRRAQKAEARKTKKHVLSIQKALLKSGKV